MTRMICGWAVAMFVCLLGVRVEGADAAAPGEAGRVLMLTSEEPRAEQQAGQRAEMGLLVRELARQAVLIAGRDELRLRTRDQTLREPFPAGADKPIEIHTLGIHSGFGRH